MNIQSCSLLCSLALLQTQKPSGQSCPSQLRLQPFPGFGCLMSSLLTAPLLIFIFIMYYYYHFLLLPHTNTLLFVTSCCLSSPELVESSAWTPSRCHSRVTVAAVALILCWTLRWSHLCPAACVCTWGTWGGPALIHDK